MFILRIFMMLVVGIISCSWCCTKKTLSSWESLVTSCCGVWSRAKKPSTPEFPKVAYQPTSGGGSDMISMGEMATLSRPSRPGFSQGQDGAPLLAHERRIVIGCQDTSRIVLWLNFIYCNSFLLSFCIKYNVFLLNLFMYLCRDCEN